MVLQNPEMAMLGSCHFSRCSENNMLAHTLKPVIFSILLLLIPIFILRLPDIKHDGFVQFIQG